MALRIVAIICARNEELHIPHTLRELTSQSVEVILIDHDSTDATRQRAAEFLGRGLLAIERLPWTGSFSLVEQLVAKQRIADQLDTDWLIHTDADEWLQAPPRFHGLREGVELVHREGYNCINFDEFTFVPLAGERFEDTLYREHMRRYYFFEPHPRRLVRAWRKDSGLRNIEGAGHRLSGPDIRLCPESFILRHYIAVSPEHAAGKYLSRTFSAGDLTQGWHGNRRNLSASKLWLRDAHRLKCLEHAASRDFDRSEPLKEHFWEW